MKLTKLVVICAVAALAGGGVAYLRYGGRSPYLALVNAFRMKTVRASGPIPEYTITMTETLTGGPILAKEYPQVPVPDHVVTSTITRAYRRDGSTAEWVKTYGYPDRTKPLTQVKIVDLARAIRIEGSAEVKAKSTTKMDQTAVASALNRYSAESNCLSRGDGSGTQTALRFAKTGTISGFPAVYLTRLDGNGTWYLTSLGCVAAEWTRVMNDRSTGQWEQTSDTKVSSIVVGPPDPSLFDLTGDEMKPSDVIRKHLVYRGSNQTTIDLQVAQAAQRDQYYSANQ